MFGKNKNQLPVSPADTEQSEKVLQTLESARDLDPRQVILVGSAALAIMGVTLESDPLKPNKPRLGDVDLASTTAEMQRQVNSGNFHPVDNVDDNQQTVIRSVITDPLPLELISRFGRGRNDDLDRHDSKFLEFWDKRSQPIEDSAFRIASPDAIKKSLRADLSDPKYQRDYTNLVNKLREK